MSKVVVLLIIPVTCNCSDHYICHYILIVTEINLVEPVLNCQFKSNCIYHALTLTLFMRWCRGYGLDCGSGDQGAIPGISSPDMGLFMARKIKTSFDVVMLG